MWSLLNKKKRERQAGGVGEEEAGSQQKSLMRGSIPGLWDHDLRQRQRLNLLSQPSGPPPLGFYLFIFKDFIYSTEIETASERGNKQGEWERKKQAPSGGA